MLYQGLLRREEDETTVQTACRNTWTLKRVLRDRGVLKGPTRADHHRVPGEQFSTKRPDTFTQTVASLNFKPLAVGRRTIHLSIIFSEESPIIRRTGSDSTRNAWVCTSQ